MRVEKEEEGEYKASARPEPRPPAEQPVIRTESMIWRPVNFPALRARGQDEEEAE